MPLSASKPWLRYYGDTPETLRYPDLTIYGLVAQTAQRYPEHIAYQFQGKKTTYRQFLSQIHAAAAGLTALGIGKGDRVALCLPNCPQVPVCLYALNRIGAVAVMIHPLSAPRQIVLCMALSKSKAILTLDQFHGKMAAIRPQLEQPAQILSTNIAEALPFPLNILYPCAKSGRHPLPGNDYIPWRRVVAAGVGVGELPADDGKADDPAVILYSGGTTGKPKGVLLSNRNLNALALQTIAASGFASIENMRMLALLPNFHGFGLGIGIHTALVGAAGCILVPQFTAKTLVNILLKQKPALMPGVPTIFEALLQSEALRGRDLSFLKGIFCGGDSLSAALKQKMNTFLRDHGCTEQIREGYGATESVAASCLTPRCCARPGSVGLPLPDMRYKIVRPGTQEEVQPGQEGEICICGPTVMLGYLDETGENADTLQLHGDGLRWLHTGDLGIMDADGFVYFRQRIKRMIVTNGYNVYPSELEAVLQGHEKVESACVVGVPDAYRGQRVRAYVVIAAGEVPSQALQQALREHCAQYIAKYALPREWVFPSELPRTPLGKVDYRKLQEEEI